MSILITHDEISLNKYLVPLKQFYGLPWWLRQLSICLQCGRPGFDPWLGRSPGEGNGTPLQYYCLENPMDRGAW